MKHSEDEQKRKQTARFCNEEGCTYMDRNGTLKRHIDIKHNGIRLRCHEEDCNFKTPWAKCLKRHAKVHLDEPVIDCAVEGCNAKVRNLEVHITSAHTDRTMYICELESCNFETSSKVYLLKHMKLKQCKLSNSGFVTTKELLSVDEKKPSKKGDGKCQKSLCSIPGCDFTSSGENDTKRKDHFRIDHRESEFTENSFIMINSAMAEAMEILEEIHKIKEESNSNED